MIVIEICSGLGNQMFRYAFARAQALENNEKLYFSKRIFKTEDREYSLDKLNIKKPNGIAPNWMVYFYILVFTFLRRINNYSLYNEKNCVDLYKKTGFYKTALRKYIEIPQTKHSLKYFNANFQSYLYFKKYENVIKEELKVIEKASSQNLIILEKIRNCNSICLHVRRGDYLDDKNKNIFDVCNFSYYSEAIKYIQKKIDDPVFFVFSEDIEWVKRQNFNGNLEYVDLNNPNYEELRLMYSCKHFIISNSTFSWWAQFLCDNPDKIVIAPKHWINDDGNECDLYMENWILISN
ncbi:alpha-1,2-fucosyltransferase [Erysipelotrichaceae bacterium OPF54]|nr:alpha-1,2-fucosyltransferase [Erysipelotrichaceae bacterium OPF54]